MDKITALYCRFAYGDVPEIIDEQKALLLQAASDNGLSNTRFYVDSGVSGLTMDRPAFNELMADMENGLIEAVIAQDAFSITCHFTRADELSIRISSRKISTNATRKIGRLQTERNPKNR